MGSGLLMTNVDHRDPFLDTSVKDRDDVTTGQREKSVDSFTLECSGNDLPAVYLRHDLKLFQKQVQAQVHTARQGLHPSSGQQRPGRKGVIISGKVFDRKHLSGVGKSHFLLRNETG